MTPATSHISEGASFRSVLFPPADLATDQEIPETPPFFSDLNIDQIVEAITAKREDHDLRPFFNLLLHTADTIEYRQQVFLDLENRKLLDDLQTFTQEMRRMRKHLEQAEKLSDKHQKPSWLLLAAGIYCEALRHLHSDLSRTDLHSAALRAFREYLNEYERSTSFTALLTETNALRAGLSEVKYSLHIHERRVKVSRYNSEPDYAADVLQVFEKFKQEETQGYRFDFHDYPEMDHVEEAILDLVARLYPQLFAALEDYYHRHNVFIDSVIHRFDREIQFYLAYLEYIDRLKRTGLPFCYPRVSHSKEVHGRAVFDLALADKLVNRNTPIVTNDFHLSGRERIMIVSGPNQGGKTTFARTFGQMHYLASLGLPVPGAEAHLFLFDNLLTHFEREENLANLSGKLEDDLLRIHNILQAATPDSILIMNESFLSTTVDDARFLSRQVMEQVVGLDILCVSVTFLDELTSFSDTAVSMVSTVEPDDPTRRTFRVVRKPADGRAYAAAIAGKYHLTYRDITRRLGEKTRSIAS